MSILIEGMEMPTACFACKLLSETYWECRVHGDANHSADRRPTDCPLVEVPDQHGRLIDELEINSRFDNGIKTISELPFPNDFVELYKQLAAEVKEEIGKCRSVIPESRGAE